MKEEDLVYYPYGETFTNTGTTNVAYKYTGKELDDSTGLYFYEARYYDGSSGRACIQVRAKQAGDKGFNKHLDRWSELLANKRFNPLLTLFSLRQGQRIYERALLGQSACLG